MTDPLPFLKGCDDPLLLAAASEIEQLRAQVAESKRCECYSYKDNERLRARLREARKLVEYAYDEMGGAWPAADAFLKIEPHEQ